MKSKEVDAYLKQSKDFAKPILIHLRNLVHQACPDVQETIKWGFPHFEYKGILCSMAAFKEHCAFTFWKAALMKDKSLVEKARSEVAMGHLGRISTLKDIPASKIMIGYIQEAVALNETGTKVVRERKVKKPMVVPDYFEKVLQKNKKAGEAFATFSPSHQREYIEWITEAKTEITRQKRIERSLEWITEGKPRSWKYARK